MDGASAPPANRTLRLALAMRGGVSLAVWIGGAVAEIDLLRRAMTPDDGELPGQARRMEVYRRMLEVAGYGGVEVDILAGASAGGLNAVIYGFAQSVGRTTDWAEGVWCDVGSLWRLLRPNPPGAPWRWWRRLRVPSLLSGDGYFYPELRTALNHQLGAVTPKDAAQPVRPARPADYVSIDLSATLAARPPQAAHPTDGRRT